MLLPLALHAQTIGRLVGTVTDDNDRPLQGAVVKVLGASPARELAINKADGSYALTGMRPGDYEIEFRASGYEAQRKSVRIAADRTSILNARLILEQPESVVGVPRAIENPPTGKGGKGGAVGTSGSDMTVRQTAPRSSEPQVSGAPNADAQKSEAPKVEALKSEPPKAEAPKAEAPKAEAPKAEVVPLPATGMTKGDPSGAGDSLAVRGAGGMLVSVIDENGRPLGGARLFLGDARKSLPSLSDGSIGVEHMAPGDYEVTLTAKGCQAEKRMVRIVANRVVTLIVKLAAEERKGG
jgi:hypothetical protein